MATGEIVFHVPFPPEHVWPRLADLELAPRWVPDLESVQKLTPGQVGVGTRYHEVVVLGGKHSEAELTVTRYEPPRVFAHEGEGGPARFTATFELEPLDGGTRVTHSWSVQLGGIMRMMEPVVKGWVQKNAEAATANFQRMLASGELSPESR